MRDIVAQAYMLSGHHTEHAASMLKLPSGVFWKRLHQYSIDMTSAPSDWPDWRIGTALGYLEEIYVLQTWVTKGYRFPDTAKTLAVPIYYVKMIVHERFTDSIRKER